MQRIPLAPEADKRTRQRARMKVNNAVYDGQFPSIRLMRCVTCDAPAEYYHHESYAPEDWFTVTPLCASCHQFVHSPRREEFFTLREKSLRTWIADIDKIVRLPEERKVALVAEWERQIRFLREGAS